MVFPHIRGHLPRNQLFQLNCGALDGYARIVDDVHSTKIKGAADLPSMFPPPPPITTASDRDRSVVEDSLPVEHLVVQTCHIEAGVGTSWRMILAGET